MNYLYLKRHNQTDKLYLGWTQKDNYEEYTGSGKYWLKHLKKHGNDVSTDLLLATESIDELRSQGKHYSKLWDVANNPVFANLKEEDGMGGSYGEETRKRMSESAIVRCQRDGPPSGAWTSERATATNLCTWQDPEVRARRSAGIKRGQAKSDYIRGPDSEEIKRKKSLALKGRQINLGRTYNMKEVACPHCGLTGKGGNMTRYHFDNCKSVGG